VTAPNPEDDFSTPIGTGMTRCESQDFDRETAEELLRKLDAYDAVRNRGAVEARHTPLGRTP
jgi:hypothetical protein